MLYRLVSLLFAEQFILRYGTVITLKTLDSVPPLVWSQLSNTYSPNLNIHNTNNVVEY